MVIIDRDTDVIGVVGGCCGAAARSLFGLAGASSAIAGADIATAESTLIQEISKSLMTRPPADA